MMKKIIVLSMIANYSFVSGWGNNNPPYNNAVLNSAYQSIQQKAINVSTSEVASRAGTETDIAGCFKEEILTDAAEDAPISEKRKMKKSMALIRAAYQARKVSGLTLEVSDFYETVALDFDNKERSLEAEKAGLWGSKLGWGLFTVVGVGGLALTAKIVRDRGDKTAAQIIGGGSVLAVTVGGGKLISTIGKEEKLKTHIAQAQTMKNAWENSFKVK